MYKKGLLVLAACTTLFFSCKKDDNKLGYIGTWKYAGGTANYSTTYINSDSLKVDDSIVHVYNCITSPINGTINITRSAWYFAEIQCDFEYSIETISYRNGYVGFTNTESYPTRGPVFGGSIKCEVIDADSVYFHDGEFKYYDFLKPLPTNDAGARISISGDTMYLHIVVDNYTGDRPYAYTHGGRLERILKYVR